MTYAALGLASGCGNRPITTTKPSQKKMMGTLDKVTLVVDLILVGAVVTLASLIVARAAGVNLGSLNSALSAAKWYPAPLLYTTGFLLFTADVMRMLMHCRAPKAKANILPDSTKKTSEKSNELKTLQKELEKKKEELNQGSMKIGTYYKAFRQLGIDPEGMTDDQLVKAVENEIKIKQPQAQYAALQGKVKKKVTSDADISTPEKAITELLIALDSMGKQMLNQSDIIFKLEKAKRDLEEAQATPKASAELWQAIPAAEQQEIITESQPYKQQASSLQSQFQALQAKVTAVETALGSYKPSEGKSIAEAVKGLVTTREENASKIQELEKIQTKLESLTKLLNIELANGQKVSLGELNQAIQAVQSNIKSWNDLLSEKLEFKKDLEYVQNTLGAQGEKNVYVIATRVMEEKQKLAKEKQDLESRVQKAETTSLTLQTSNSQLTTQNQSLQGEVNRLKSAAAGQESQTTEIEKLKQQVQELTGSNRNQSEQIQSLEREKSKLETDKTNALAEVNALKKDTGKLPAALPPPPPPQFNPVQDQSELLKKLQDENDRLRAEVKTLKEKKAPTELEVQQIRADANQQLAIKEGRIKQLEKQLDDLTSHGAGSHPTPTRREPPPTRPAW